MLNNLITFVISLKENFKFYDKKEKYKKISFIKIINKFTFKMNMDNFISKIFKMGEWKEQHGNL